MALELKQHMKLSQQLIITPQLQQAIKLLQLSRLELLETIQQELETNPVLEETVDQVGNKEEVEPETPPVEERYEEVEITEKVRDDFDWESFLEDYSTYSPMPMERDPNQEQPSFEQRLTRRPSLEDHLMWQLCLSEFTEEEKEIATMIIGNLNADGYLVSSTAEISQLCGASVEEVERVLGKVQAFDPPGVAARDLRECLLIQAKSLDVPNGLVVTIIDKYLHYLEKKNYQGLVKALRRPKGDVQAAVEVILSLDPKPGRAFSEEEAQYVSPDIYVVKVDDQFMVVLNEDGMPKLRVNPYYREALRSGSAVSEEAKDYIQGKLRSAAWLIKSIHQRQRTLHKVAQSIVNFQREFLEKGIAYLKPMVLRDVAEDVGMHESTISRVTTNKYMHTPQGIFELKYFFNSSINSVVGEAVASESVKERIRQLIKEEDPAKPYSDKDLVDLLKKENIKIARRTVAKYREMMGILPSHKRKQVLWGS
ncbi:RNA polymerase, sigma 54 subunit, RpoN/SigL [Desulfacinum hydrothermale DSM 13146]|uniref:RNA polymerase, sigma 54 subunit, RpoN/SigL n=1 Tax=Desulfacinum hydrothermale DSM 13146 TaxID=1121390 RepID=A0A1W1XS08_9BACT|nr:RNA polymerase factor sigma-54 [Desulfacinum hydrothermale]SMC26632.1 RNA polymerase, sigma 54 subunit, RpoN/SigL [Desulfacinum hydrothermale DSM 13146]